MNSIRSIEAALRASGRFSRAEAKRRAAEWQSLQTDKEQISMSNTLKRALAKFAPKYRNLLDSPNGRVSRKPGSTLRRNTLEARASTDS